MIRDAFGSSSSTISLHLIDNASGETLYAIYEFTGSSFIQVQTRAANSTSATLTGLAPNTLHLDIVAASRGGSALTYAPHGI